MFQDETRDTSRTEIESQNMEFGGSGRLKDKRQDDQDDTSGRKWDEAKDGWLG